MRLFLIGGSRTRQNHIIFDLIKADPSLGAVPFVFVDRPKDLHGVEFTDADRYHLCGTVSPKIRTSWSAAERASGVKLAQL